ncbi:hypothetical protein [Maricaulis sp.]|uniref:hypothetical protein n=1 Tax=Maricaulis sp. TaxID=1486257 RepID=UPI003296D291
MALRPSRPVVLAGGVAVCVALLRAATALSGPGGAPAAILIGLSAGFAVIWMADFALSTWWARRLGQPPGMAFKWQRFLVGGPAIGLSTLCGLSGALLSASAANGAYDSAASIVFFSLFAAAIAGAWYAFLASPISVGVARRYYRGL